MDPLSTVPVTISPASAESTLGANQGSQEERTLNLAVAAGVRALNQASYLGEGREVQRSVAPGTHTPVIKVVDTQTKEVITQWPPEYLLQIAAELKAKTRDSG